MTRRREKKKKRKNWGVPFTPEMFLILGDVPHACNENEISFFGILFARSRAQNNTHTAQRTPLTDASLTRSLFDFTRTLHLPPCRPSKCQARLKCRRRRRRLLPSTSSECKKFNVAFPNRNEREREKESHGERITKEMHEIKQLLRRK